ncbi:MAG TPA: hypothetical protein V6D35_01105 [Candidatus Sericytochromatia bacterium]
MKANRYAISSVPLGHITKMAIAFSYFSYLCLLYTTVTLWE